MTQHYLLTCTCGQVELETEGAPFVSSECHCNSCRTAAQRREMGRKVDLHTKDGGIPYSLFRKDRVTIKKGREHLAWFTLTDQSRTRRYVSQCCQTPMFVEFDGGHWMSIYQTLWPPTARPPLNIRTMVSDRDKADRPDRSIPWGSGTTLGFFAGLFGQWVAMGFKSPRLNIDRKIQSEQ